jgi:hypothetical protein
VWKPRKTSRTNVSNDTGTASTCDSVTRERASAHNTSASTPRAHDSFIGSTARNAPRRRRESHALPHPARRCCHLIPPLLQALPLRRRPRE